MDRFTVTAVLVIAWSVRLFAYSIQELGLDGHLSVGLALLPTGRLLEFLTRDVHPPLYYLLLKGWLGVAGISFLGARWLSLAAGMLSLALLYRLGASLAEGRGAAVGLLLLTLSPAHIAASATARDFGPGFLLSVGTLVVWQKLWWIQEAHRRRSLLVVLTLLTALALATWYFHACFVFIQLADLLLRRKAWRGPSLALALGMVAQIPWLIMAGPPLLKKLFGGVTVSGKPPAPAAFEIVAERVGSALVGALPEPVPAALGAAPWVLLVLLGLARAFRGGGPLARCAVLSIVGLVLGGAAIYGLTSIWAEPSLLGRYALVVLPWAFLAQAWAFGTLPRDRSQGGAVNRPMFHPRLQSGGQLALVALVLGAQAVDFAALVRSAIPWEREPSVAIVEADGQPGDAVVFSDHARYGLYLLRRQLAFPAASIHFAGSAFLRDDVPREAKTLLTPLLAQHERIWFTYDQPAHSASLAEIQRDLLADRFLVRRYERGPTVVELFAPVTLLEAHTSDWQFGDAIALTGWAITPAVRQGEHVFVELRWQALRAPGADYKVFAHLLDANGERAAQHDGEPMLGLRPTTGWQPGETIVDRFAIQVPEGAAPGEYAVLVGLYRGEERLRLADGGDHVRLGPVTIGKPGE